MNISISTNMKKALLGAAIGVAVILGATGLWMFTGLFGSPFHIDETTYIYVRPTDTEATIIQQLKDVTHTSSMRGWRLANKLTTFTPRTGRYAVVPGESMLDVYRKLQRGRQEPVRFTLPSVRTLERLAGAMADKLMLDSATVADSLCDEQFAARYGYDTQTLPALFIPNTYELYWDISLAQFMQRMERENEAFWQTDNREAKARDMQMSRDQVVTLASIIDEETSNNGTIIK